MCYRPIPNEQTKHQVGGRCPGVMHMSAPLFVPEPCLDAPEFAKAGFPERLWRPLGPTCTPIILLDQLESNRLEGKRAPLEQTGGKGRQILCKSLQHRDTGDNVFVDWHMEQVGLSFLEGETVK